MTTDRDQALVSIGILSYNRPVELRAAIESVISQTYTNLEILISDNGSTVEETKAVIAEYAGKDARIRPFLHQINRGPQFNFKFLLDQANGEYYSWLADDDLLSPSYVADGVAVLERTPSTVFATNMPVLNGTGKALTFNFVPHTVGLPAFKKYELLIRYAFNDVNVFYYGIIRTESLRKCSLYLKMLFGGDLLLPLELIQYGDMAINRQKPGYVYTLHANQTSGSTLRYKQITLQPTAGFVERRAFFTAYIGYMIRLIFQADTLTLKERTVLSSEVLQQYIRTRRFHLLKYDLGVHRIIQAIKRAFRKNS